MNTVESWRRFFAHARDSNPILFSSSTQSTTTSRAWSHQEDSGFASYASAPPSRSVSAKPAPVVQDDPYIEDPPKGCWHYFTRCLCSESIVADILSIDFLNTVKFSHYLSTTNLIFNNSAQQCYWTCYVDDPIKSVSFEVVKVHTSHPSSASEISHPSYFQTHNSGHLPNYSIFKGGN